MSAIITKRKPTWLRVLEAAFTLLLRIGGFLLGASAAVAAFVVGLLLLALVVGGLVLLNDLVWGQLQ